MEEGPKKLVLRAEKEEEEEEFCVILDRKVRYTLLFKNPQIEPSYRV